MVIFFIFLHLSLEVLTFLLPRPPGDSRVPWVPLGASWLPPGCLLGASLVSPGCLLGVSLVFPWSPDVSQMLPNQFNSIQFNSNQIKSNQFNFNQIKSNQFNSRQFNSNPSLQLKPLFGVFRLSHLPICLPICKCSTNSH